jgi:hypothetical protein
LLIHDEKLGLLENLVMEVLKVWFWHNVTYRKANTSNQSVKCKKHVLYECMKRKRKRF